MPVMLKSLRVTHISLVGNPANREKVIWKSEARPDGAEPLSLEIPVIKSDDKRMVYGLVCCPDRVDAQGEYTSKEEIEKAAYDFMRDQRTRAVDTQHDFVCKEAFVAESWIVKGRDPLFGEAPEGSWAVGIRVDDDAVWKSVKDGTLKGLSLAGFAQKVREPQPDSGGILKGVLDLVRAIKGEPASGGSGADVVPPAGPEARPDLAPLLKALEPLEGLPEEIRKMAGRIEALEKATPGLQAGALPGGGKTGDVGGIL